MLTYLYNILFNKKVKFYYLSLIKEEKGWSIHGLWPQYDINSYPSYCKIVKFNIDNIKCILNELEKYWYSEKQNIKDDETFWEHEWKKHGSCLIGENINEYFYFSKTLNLYKEVIEKQLPDKYYNEKTQKCLIPYDLEFNLIN